MFGDNYFKTRERLADLAARVIEIADRTGADQSPMTDDGIVHGLISPFLFVACGESQSGKSMLLNGIFGQEVCQISNGGRPPKVRWYKHAKKSANKEVTPLVEECYRPVDFLEHFNLMDTPGTDVSIGDLGNLECQKITERFLPASDLVFWVLPVSNPWGASLWKFFSAQSDAILKKSVIILQQTDLKDEGDIEIILGHVRDLAQQRLGTVPPIFPVSGLWSMRAKRSNPVDAQLWHDSGYPALERHIVELVEHSPARQRMLLDIRKSLAEVLRSIEQAVEHRAHLLEGNEQFLRDLV
jgi:tRNA U34 5-carboxymethylaminomethyl modifying GTPase MnmE/TrmE